MQIATILETGTDLVTYADGTLVPGGPSDSDAVDITAIRVGDALQGSAPHGGWLSEVSVYSGVLT